MGRPSLRTDRDELPTYWHERNVICSSNFLDALKVHHGHDDDDPPPDPKVFLPVEPPPIPNAALLKFPKYMGRVEAIQRATLTEFPDMTLAEMKSPQRDANVVKARQIAVYLSKKLTSLSLPEIGRRFGGRDHTTILHSVRKIEYLVKRDKDLSDMIKRIKIFIPEAAE